MAQLSFIKNSLSVYVFSLLLILIAGKTLAQEAPTKEENEAPSPVTSDEKPVATNAPRPNIDTEKNSIALIADELDTSEQVWLQAPSEQFLALWQKDRTGNPFGAVLILHGEGQTVDEPDEINALRLSLVHHGWATLSINLPNTKKAKIPPRPTPTPPSTNTSEKTGDEKEQNEKNAEAMAEDIEKKIDKTSVQNSQTNNEADPEDTSKSRLDAAIAYLNKQGQYNIVIVGHGVAATRAIKYIQSMTGRKNIGKVQVGVIQRPIRAVIWVAARNNIPETPDHIDQFISDPELPILDIYYGEHYLDDIETKARYRSTREKGVAHYYQVKMMRPTGSDEDHENRLTRRIRGFLDRHAKGVEVGR
ncbi:MAG: alpha/beta hydrolase family protein [Agarilytica sp.]